MTCTMREAYNNLSKRFKLANSDAPNICAKVLLMHALEVDAIFFATNPQQKLSSKQWLELESLALRHEAGEPLAYIIGYKEFYGRKFFLNTHTLIPRPESEDILDAAIKAVQVSDAKFLDIGTGSGCLGLSFAAERPKSRGILLDIQAGALAMASKNAKNLNLSKQVNLVQGDLRHLGIIKNSLDLIISNPPYVSEGEYENLLPNVKNFEPKIALVPRALSDEHDEHGLLHIKLIASVAYDALKKNGVCIVEHGSSQGEHVREIFEKNGKWDSVETGNDLALLERFCICKK